MEEGKTPGHQLPHDRPWPSVSRRGGSPSGSQKGSPPTPAARGSGPADRREVAAVPAPGPAGHGGPGVQGCARVCGACDVASCLDSCGN